MRAFFLTLFILAGLLCSSLPSAALGSRNAITNLQAIRDEIVGSGKFPLDAAAIVADLRTSLLSSSYKVFEDSKNAYIGAFEDFTIPGSHSSDLWEEAKKMEQTLLDHVLRFLKEAETYFESTAFTDIPHAMENIVLATATFRSSIQDALDAHHITLDVLTQEFETIFMESMRKPENIPPLDEEAPGHADWCQVMPNKVLDDIELALLDLAARYGIEKDIITAYMGALRPHVQRLIVAICDINERCPELLPALVFSVIVLLIPEQWILKACLSVLGFGPAGPLKGSFAAWMQSYFWGPEVAAGSWFSFLQAAGMGVPLGWGGVAIKASLIIGSMSVALLRCR